MKRTLLLVLMAGITGIYGCGGGGGGGSSPGGASSTPSPTISTSVRSLVPFSTPVLAGTVEPFASGATATTSFVGDSYTASISGSGQDFITVGFQSCPCTVATHINSRINMFSWKNGSLVDVTAQWFPNGSNEILGSYAVKFGDFFRSGRIDMLVVPGADKSDLTGPAYLFVNNGSSFSRTTIDLGSKVNAQDLAIVDVNGDGYLDFISTDTGQQMTFGINNKSNNFTLYNTKNSSGIASASGAFLAVGDFLNNGTVTFILNGGLHTTYNGVQVTNVGLYSWGTDANNKLTFTLISRLPQSRFLLPKWTSKSFTSYENLGIVPIDINNDGKLDVAMFSQPVKSNDNNYSEVQFMQNDGSGNFTDVTDTVLVGYNNSSRVSYVPRLFDINGDGLMDILASGGDSNGTSTQWLLKSSDGKYVAKWAGQSTDFLTQTYALAGGSAVSADHSNSVNFIKDPSGQLHLVTYVNIQGAGRRQLQVYTSLLGFPASGNAQQTSANLGAQAWPYLKSATHNPSLATTAQNY